MVADPTTAIKNRSWQADWLLQPSLRKRRCKIAHVVLPMIAPYKETARHPSPEGRKTGKGENLLYLLALQSEPSKDIKFTLPRLTPFRNCLSTALKKLRYLQNDKDRNTKWVPSIPNIRKWNFLLKALIIQKTRQCVVKTFNKSIILKKSACGHSKQIYITCPSLGWLVVVLFIISSSMVYCCCFLKLLDLAI